MEYMYAALILNENNEEINEENMTSVLEAANVDVTESEVKAIIAALENENLDEIIDEATQDSPEEQSRESVGDDDFEQDGEVVVSQDEGTNEGADDGEFDDLFN